MMRTCNVVCERDSGYDCIDEKRIMYVGTRFSASAGGMGEALAERSPEDDAV